MASLHNLTPRQFQVLAFLQSCAPAMPTVREISRQIGVVNSNASGLLVRLEREGWIRRLKGRARAIEILRHLPAARPLTANEGMEFARAWRMRMKPYFDGLYGAEAGDR